jgi:hypothetical protein
MDLLLGLGSKKTSEAGVWEDDGDADRCYCCHSTFGLLNRRHHCRQCGKVVCNPCSENRKLLESSRTGKAKRVCTKCWDGSITPNLDAATKSLSKATLDSSAAPPPPKKVVLKPQEVPSEEAVAALADYPFEGVWELNMLFQEGERLEGKRREEGRERVGGSCRARQGLAGSRPPGLSACAPVPCIWRQLALMSTLSFSHAHVSLLSTLSLSLFSAVDLGPGPGAAPASGVAALGTFKSGGASSRTLAVAPGQQPRVNSKVPLRLTLKAKGVYFQGEERLALCSRDREAGCALEGWLCDTLCTKLTHPSLPLSLSLSLLSLNRHFLPPSLPLFSSALALAAQAMSLASLPALAQRARSLAPACAQMARCPPTSRWWRAMGLPLLPLSSTWWAS